MSQVLVFGYIFLLGYLLFLYCLLHYIVRRRRVLWKAIPASVLFISLLGLTVYFFWQYRKGQSKTIKEFSGDYKLNNLDGIKCENCIVRLKEDNTYDIIVQGENVANGEWSLKTAIDIPGAILDIDNGTVKDQYQRIIENVNRRSFKGYR